MAFSKRLKVILALSAVLIVVQAINTITGNSLVHFGIIPRSLDGLRGIFLLPFCTARFNTCSATCCRSLC